MAKSEIKNLVTNSLISRIIKASDNEYADTLAHSEIVNNKDFFTTPIPALNIALSGEIDGGMEPGCMQVVGESKSFKTLFMLVLAKAYMDKYPQSVFVLFDSEHGAALEYFESLGIDANRVAHMPIQTVEDLRGQANKILDETNRGDKLFLGVDSIGLLASNKEVKDALSGNEAADLTRAKALNSFFRTIVSVLPIKDIPMVIINHSYDSIGGFIPTKTVKGGKGGYLASNYIWMITRANDREKSGKKALKGFKFTINIEKSRRAIEKAKIPIMVSFEGGIDRHSGLLDIAIDLGFITKPTVQSFEYKGEKVGKEAKVKPWLEELITDPAFIEAVKNKYKQAGKELIQGTPDETLNEAADAEISE